MRDLPTDGIGGGTLFVENLPSAPFARLTGEKRVLFFAPKDFNRADPFRVFVFFHGDLGNVEGNVAGLGAENFRYRLPHQVAAADAQTLLIAPQRPDAPNRSGSFATTDAFAAFLAEAEAVLAVRLGVGKQRLAAAPLALGAFSGGREPCRHVLRIGGVSARIRAVILVDVFFGANGPRLFGDLMNANSSWTSCLHYGPETRANSDGAFAAVTPASRVLRENESQFGSAELAVGKVLVCKGATPHARIVADGIGGSPIRKMLERLLPAIDAPGSS